MTRQTNRSTKASIVNNDHIVADQQTQFSPEAMFAYLGIKPTGAGASILKTIARVLMYVTGVVASLYIVSWLSVAMVMGGWPLFLVMILEVTAIILACIASWKLSDTVIDYLSEGRLTKDISNIFGWSKRKVVSAAETVQDKVSSMLPAKQDVAPNVA
jgi:hypothetical protein